MTRFRTLPLALLLISIVATDSPAASIPVTDNFSFKTALGAATDGDEILLAPGTYTGKFFADGLTGITIRSADAANRAVLDAAGDNESLFLRNVTRLTLSDLIVENAAFNGINIDDGGTFDTPSTDVTLRNILVRNIGSTGNEDGIRLHGIVGFHVDRIRVDNWGNGGGAGLDLGGAHQGLVENSFFRNDDSNDSFGVQAKAGSSDIVIRANRFEAVGSRAIQLGGFSALAFFRPQPPGTVEASGMIAEGNVITGTEAAIAYVNTADGIVRNNFLFRPTNWVARMQKENNSPGFVDTQNGQFLDNVIVWDHGDLAFFSFVNVSSNTLPETFTFARNQWYNRTVPALSAPVLVAPLSDTDSIVGVDPMLDIDRIVPWQFDWGTWLVNASDNVDTHTLTGGDPLLVATPGIGAEFDPGRPFPLIGSWSFAPLTGTDVTLDPFSQAILISASLVPEPSSGLLAAGVLAIVSWRRRRSSAARPAA